MLGVSSGEWGMVSLNAFRLEEDLCSIHNVIRMSHYSEMVTTFHQSALKI